VGDSYAANVGGMKEMARIRGKRYDRFEQELIKNGRY
jgi:hypothetical protein